MGRIDDKFKIVRPDPVGTPAKGRDERTPNDAALPPNARLASTRLTPAQRQANQLLVTLYHAVQERESERIARSARQTSPAIKGWSKRKPNDNAGAGKKSVRPRGSPREDEDQEGGKQ